MELYFPSTPALRSNFPGTYFQKPSNSHTPRKTLTFTPGRGLVRRGRDKIKPLAFPSKSCAGLVLTKPVRGWFLRIVLKRGRDQPQKPSKFHMSKVLGPKNAKDHKMFQALCTWPNYDPECFIRCLVPSHSTPRAVAPITIAW